jgi:2-keto-4-pentenoate hydratase/2-oxohepta-3-ene-1,7-dioic acid hydratase in catechol pathway
MKLVTFRSGGPDARVGVQLDEAGQILDLKSARGALGGAPTRAFESMLDLIESGQEGLDAARNAVDARPEEALVDAAAATLLTPVPRPPQIRDCLCFEEHLTNAYKVLREVRAASEPDPEAALAEFEKMGLFQIPEVWYRQPIYYKANRFSVIGPEQDVLWPDYAEILDYELEFGFFVGREGKNVPREKAREHVFGYSIFNDISARDAQTAEMPGGLGPAKGKDFDTGNIIGPCIVTADEIDPYDLTMIARVNGEEWSRGWSGSIHWTFEDLIAHVTRSETIHPGEFFGSGTVGGGCGLELRRYLSPGDVVELEVEGIGILRNRIVKET